jgi:hypothetical protein
MKKDQMELFELLATKHLEKNRGLAKLRNDLKLLAMFVIKAV